MGSGVGDADGRSRERVSSILVARGNSGTLRQPAMALGISRPRSCHEENTYQGRPTRLGFLKGLRTRESAYCDGCQKRCEQRTGSWPASMLPSPRGGRAAERGGPPAAAGANGVGWSGIQLHADQHARCRTAIGPHDVRPISFAGAWRRSVWPACSPQSMRRTSRRRRAQKAVGHESVLPAGIRA